MEMIDEEEEIDLQELFFYLLKRIWVILTSGVVVGVAAALVTILLIAPIYSSTSKLYILSKSTSITSLADVQLGSSLTKDYVQLAQCRPVADIVIENLGLDYTYKELINMMEFETPSDTRILVITCENEDPILAKSIVDEYATVVQTRISEIMRTDAPTVAEWGYIAEDPDSPNKLKNTAIGFLVGFLLATAVFTVLFLLDDSVKTAEDIEKYLGINTLTAIPLREDEESSKKKKIIRKRGSK